MVVDGQSRLDDVIAADPSAFARLAALDPVIAELSKTGRRAADATDLTLREVAQRSGVPLADVLTVAAAGPGGCGASPDGQNSDDAAEPAPPWLAEIDPATAATIDVRPILAQNGEPFGQVLDRARGVNAGASLIIDAPFDPQPLRRVLESQGFATFGRALSDGHWRIWCLKAPSAPSLRPAGAPHSTRVPGQAIALAGAQQRLLPENIPLRFFAIGIMAHLLAWGGLIAAADDVATSGGGPGPSLAVGHLLNVGVLLAVAFGASLQMLPVALARPAPPRWACEAIWALLALGLVPLVLGFLDVDPRLIGAGSGLLAAAALLYAATMAGILVSARDLPLVRRHLWVALASLTAAVAIAAALAANYHIGWLSDHPAWAMAHAVLAAYGFMGFLVTGFSWILVPMFATADASETAADRAAMWVAAMVLMAGTIATVARQPGLTAIAGAIGLLTALLHVRSMLSILRGRLRRRLGGEFWLIGLSWAMFPLSLLLAVLLVLDLLPDTGAALFVFVLLFGWLLSVLTGVLQRILPFLASMHVARVGGRPISPNRLAMETPLLVHRWGHCTALAAVASGILFDVTWFIRVGAVAGLVGGLGLAVFAVGVRLRTRQHLKVSPIVSPKGKMP